LAALAGSHRDLKQLRVWLRDRNARDEARVFVVEGPRTLDALIGRGLAPRVVYVDERSEREGVVVAPGVLDKIADARTSPGVIAVFDRTFDAVAAADWAVRCDHLLVLARINDPGNLGTIARSAQAAGFEAIVVGPGSVDPYNPKTVRAGAGAIGSLPVWAPREEADVRNVLDTVSSRGGVRLGAAAGAPMSIDEAPLDVRPLAVVLGHETGGIGDLPLDATVGIPMADGSESLNVAMAATVLCFETARRRRSAS
jgi:RNA methyltransferase, TrmH family